MPIIESCFYFLKKNKKYICDFPKLWVANPKLYPQSILVFRKIKNKIIQYNNGTNKIILLTGAEKNVGVSSVAFNLSFLIGWDIPSWRIIIIDTNSYNPTLHKTFSINRTPGITDFLYNEVSIEEIIYKTSIDNLYVVPFGKGCENMSSPFTRDIFSDFIEYLRNRYNLIVIDAEPILNSAYTQNLTVYSDGVIVVVEAEKTSLKKINEIHIQSMENKVTVIGFFLNRYRFVIPPIIDRLL